MRRIAIAAFMALVSIVAPALAHTSNTAMSIAENAALTSAPSEFTVTFSAPTGLANVALTNAAGQAVALDYTPPRQMAASYTIPLPRPPGSCRRDGHAMPGQVRFTITG